MNNIPLSLHLDKEYSQILECAKMQLKQKPLPIVVSGMPPVVENAFLASFCKDFYSEFKKPLLILVKDDKTVLHITNYLKTNGIRAYRFLRRELNIYNITASHENEHERLLVLSNLLFGEPEVIVATPAASMGLTMPKAVLDNNRFVFCVGDIDEPKDMIERLLEMGYTRVENVEYVGQFSARGGIIDIFPPCLSLEESQPYRIEYFDNEIDRICLFDRMTQRVVENKEQIEIIPVREVLCGESGISIVKKEIKECLKKNPNEDSKKELESELSAIEGNQPLNFTDKYISLIYPEKECLLDYFADKTAVILCGTNAIDEQIDAVERLDGEIISGLLEHGVVRNGKTMFSVEKHRIKAFIDANLAMHLNAFAVGLSGVRVSGIFSLKCRQLTSYFKKYELLKEDLTAFVKGKYRILLACENEAEVKSMIESLVSDGFQAVSAKETPEKFEPGVIYVTAEKLSCGYELFGPKFAALTLDSDDSNRFMLKKQRKSSKVKNGQKILSYADLQIGDYVVHSVYGIGKYLGIQNITVCGVSRDYINIQYAGTDKLFLPVDNLDMVSKYIGAHSDDGLLKLSKMGGADWQKSKAKAKAAVKEMAKDLIKLYAERMRRSGFAFPADDQMQKDFESAFEYLETDSQLSAISEIKRDMMNPSPMDRLLCGDVGFGKTEVALRGAFKAISAGKQVALLVPTTILALQHYHTALSRMRNFPVKVEMISRFRSPKQQGEIIRSLKRGETDMIIGTHRLISSDIEFKDLGLVIVDEEQRFGVAQKEKLKQIAKNVDVLSLSATPIPRTLNMALGGLRDMSVLDEPPEDRLPVQTYVLEHDNIIIGEAIRRELARGGQVFYLYNRVDSIEYVASRIARDNPTATVAVAHGKMDREEIEEIWHAMINGSIDVLVCTTIIETGVDVPNANTLIIEDADRMGLSQLHQLRGRVGRSGRRAFAYFTYKKGKEISEIANKRLSAIREYAEFGAGFRIALRDLEIRGAGDLLGAQQHGHLDAVGYDMYIKLLNEAVLEEKGEKIEEKKECKIDIPLDAYIPDTYIYSSAGRMEMYKKIALISTEEDLDDVADELLDRYGEFGTPVKNLIYISLIRHMAERIGMSLVKVENGEIRIYADKFDIAKWSSVAFELDNRVRFVTSIKTFVSCKLKKGEDLLKVLLKIFKTYEAEQE